MNTRDEAVKALEETEIKVRQELADAAPQLAGDPTLMACSCTEKQVCKLCPVAKKKKFLEWVERKTLSKGRAPNRRYLVVAEKKSDPHSAKFLKHRMKELKKLAEKKLGRKLSNREFRDYTEIMAKSIYEKEKNEVQPLQ